MLKRYLAQDLTVEKKEKEKKKHYCGLLSMHRTSGVMVLI